MFAVLGLAILSLPLSISPSGKAVVIDTLRWAGMTAALSEVKGRSMPMLLADKPIMCCAYSALCTLQASCHTHGYLH
jgi:hypothetical protein